MGEGSASQTTGGETAGTASQPRRALALDALRGLAILGMVFSGDVPEDVFPAWMYHAQDPPGQQFSHHFRDYIAGLTWVDLVFPFFIFSMGAAISLALSRRLEQGRSYWSIGGGIVYRAFLLGAFALYVAHISPDALSRDPTVTTWLLALLGFVLLFPILARLPRSWPLWRRLSLRAVGWAGAVIMMASLQFAPGHYGNHGGGLSGFSVERSDIIIVLLTNVALFGSFLWLLSRGNLLLRLGFLGFLIAARLAAHREGWVGWIDDHSPLPWMLQLSYLQWLFIAIPGTIVGDRVVVWIRSTKGESAADREWSVVRIFGLVALMVAFLTIVLIGMQSRWVWPTTVVVAAMCLLGWWLVRGPSTETERLVKDLYPWGVYWLLLGLTLEPFEGGIKKMPDTMSYYLVTAGLAIFVLIAGTIVIHMWRRQRWFQLLIDNGQNPMIAYVGAANLIWPIIALTHLDRPIDAITQSPWSGLLAGILSTVVLAYVVRVFTRARVFWRT